MSRERRRASAAYRFPGPTDPPRALRRPCEVSPLRGIGDTPPLLSTRSNRRERLLALWWKELGSVAQQPYWPAPIRPAVLRSTFVHLSGVGPIGEAALWRSGVLDWTQLRDSIDSLAFPPDRAARLRAELAVSERALRDRDCAWFAHRLPKGEVWRIFPEFRSETAFLDIETTSLSPYEGIVTVVTVHGAGATRTFVADDNLEELPAYLRRFSVLVTFNGSLFDVPFLQVRFPELQPPVAHIDLRFVLYRLGQAGGLKRIESRLGLGSRDGVEGIHGLDAVRLWERFRRGDRGSLEKLIQYNRADTVNLEPLAEYASSELRRRLLPTESVSASPRGSAVSSTDEFVRP